MADGSEIRLLFSEFVDALLALIFGDPADARPQPNQADLALAAKQREQAAKVLEVDAALRGVDVERQAVPAQYRVDPSDDTMRGFVGRRDALANATTVPTITLELNNAPRLLAEIGQADTTAKAARATWDRLQSRRNAVKFIIDDARGYLNQTMDSPAKPPVAAEQNKVEQAFADLASVATLPLLDTALSALERTAPTVQTAAHEVWADHGCKLDLEMNLGWLDGWQQEYAKTSPTNPLTADVARLHQAKTIAEREPDARTRGNALARLSQEVRALTTEAGTLDAQRKYIGERLGFANSWLVTIPKGQEGTLPVRYTDATARLTSIGALTSMSTFASELASLRIVADQLYEDCLAASVPDAASRALKTLSYALPDFTKIAVPNAVQNLYGALVAREGAAALLTGSARVQALKSVADEAFPASSLAWQAIQTQKDVRKRTYALQQGAFSSLGIVNNGADPLVAEQWRILNNFAYVCSQTAGGTVVDLKAGFDNIVPAVDALKLATDKRLAAAIDIDGKSAAILATLDKIDGIIRDLKPGTDKSTYQPQAVSARQTLAGIAGLATDDDKKAALLTLDRTVSVLLRSVGNATFSTILKAPAGAKLLDNMVKELGETTSDPSALALVQAAMEARFKVKLDFPEGMPLKRLPTIYAMFAKVPAGHVGHDSLTKLEYETDPDINTSYYDNGKVVLNYIGDGTMNTYPFKNQGDPTQEVKMLNYFKAITLHEIGHAVDAKDKVMKLENDQFGGWKSATMDDVALAMFDTSFSAFVGPGLGTKEDVLALIKGLLTAGEAGVRQPAAATDALGSLLAQWGTIAASQGWKNCLSVRNPASSPWERPVGCSNGFAYHEAYPGVWWSYKHSARGAGVSDYQWRAPGEWFADLYAYHHMLGKAVPACVSDAITK